MTLPVVEAAVINDHGFYFNKTLNSYYEHLGMDFSAEEGAQVFAVEDGVVESIYKDDLLSGTEIVVAHADGVKSVYRFVVETESLKVGAQVKKGDVIATVAAATGDEYKDGAHLHFEILKNGTSVDPTGYLTLEEK
jgi:murein DD-endopeptidase MepM/ murein hydrolase activator NlpD